MVYFSEIFGVSEAALEEYGAFDISLINDLPLFIDPFLLYASEKEEYKELHSSILTYLSFLKSKAELGVITEAKISRWFHFPEVKQVWFGYSETGNCGAGLGSKFGNAMSNVISSAFQDLFNEKISHTSHLEKLGLFKSGVGRDMISDFTCNLIKQYLLEYTQKFAMEHLSPSNCKKVRVQKVYFDYKLESWMPKTYYLPFFNGDYVMLTPKDILTKDENWINFSDMKNQFHQIVNSIPNIELRDRLNDLYARLLPKKPKSEDFTNAITAIVSRFPEYMDYYIRYKEGDKEGAKSNSKDIVKEASEFYVRNIGRLIERLKGEDFYRGEGGSSFEETRRRVMFLKHMIEDKDGYQFFYSKNKPIKREKDLQLLFKLVWFGSIYDVNAEVNNGRGPVDFKVSNGSSDMTLVEFKLAGNSKLKQNLRNQVGIYEKANETSQSLKVILYFSDNDFEKVMKILKELKIENDPNIILIDARDNKASASNVK